MATARMTLGSIFGAINDAATSVSSTFSTVTKAVDMANVYVSTAAQKQKIDATVDLHTHKRILIETKSMEEAERRRSIADFRAKDKLNDDLFAAAYNDIEKALANL